MNLKNRRLSLFLSICLLCCNLAFAGLSKHSTPSVLTTIPQNTFTPLSLFAEGASAGPGQEFCLDITTANFDSIVSMQFTMNWDTAVMKFVSASLVDMPDQSTFGFGATNACSLGVLAVSWNAIQDTMGFVSVPDGTVLFELCFMALGEVNDCTPLAFSGSPLTIEVTNECSNGADIGLNSSDGTICVIEPIGLISTMYTHVNCANAGEGAIDLTFEGGTPPYTYQWSGPDLLDPGTEDLSNLVDGTYYLTLTDASMTPIVRLDTFEINGNYDIAVANAGADTSMNCYNNNGQIELSGSSDPDDSDIFYEWFTNDGNIVSGTFTLSPDIDAPGTYYLRTFNNFSNCSDTSAVFVADNTIPPFVDAGATINLNCSQSMPLLNGTNSDQGPEMEYSWIATNGGNIVNGDSTLTPMIDAPGIYTLEVFNSLSGCTGSGFVEITQDSNLPTAVAGEDTLLTCAVPQIVLSGAGSSVGNNYAYQWSSDNGNMILNATTLSPTISAPGTYLLVVSDGLCADSAMVVVSDGQLEPSVNAGDPILLTCSTFAGLLDGTNSTQGAGYAYEWTTINGNISEGENTLTPLVDDCGLYTLHVTNLLTGCIGSSSVLVDCDTVPPVIELGEEQFLSCVDSIVTIDASNSSVGPDFTYTWNTVFGNIVSGLGTTVITVNDAGLYGLLIEDDSNGCIALNSVLVSFDTLAPMADAGQAVTIECGDPILLNGNNSTQGDSILYLWTTFNGSITLDPATTTPTIDAGGEYIIWVTNENNGCVATDTVLVDGAAPLEDALLEVDSVLCGNETALTGNLPFNASGIWTSSNPNDFIENPMSGNTLVMDLESGWHTFFWVLSTPECPDYDLDSMQVFVEGTPDAIEDQFDLSGYTTTHEINLLENDDTSPVQEWTLGLVSTPEAGELADLGNGLFEFTFPAGYFGIQSFEYALCNEFCPDQCDTTTVLLNISEPIDTITDIPNGITPNGDGMNDAFIIPEIKKNPELYPDNELLVYNRWGDVVYKSKPYNNDWQGNNNSGNELPQGTYYYLLRLNVAEGAIFQGDITILR